ncbi:tail fiber domain-containing protein [Emticicia agri]|nr:tail fiber domain-containing protein [Emticicia agri]
MKPLLLTALLLSSLSIFAQSGIVAPTGIAFPRYTTVNRPAANSVAIGTMIYNSTNNAYQYSNGSSWLNLLGTNVLPVGSSEQTLRNNGSGWVADNFLKNSGNQIKIGTDSVNADYLLTVGNGNNTAGILSIGNTYGVWGNSFTGDGVHGTSNSNSGVSGVSNTASGVYGLSTSGSGVYGASTSNAGTSGVSTNGAGVFGAGGTHGIYGFSGLVGVYGLGTDNTNGFGVSGAGGAYGVYGNSTNGIGTAGISSANTGVYGSSSSGFGMNGVSNSGIGIKGESSDSYGVSGISTNNYGIYGASTNGYGIYGVSTAGLGGIKGETGATNGYGIYGKTTNASTTSYAGYFEGKLKIVSPTEYVSHDANLEIRESSTLGPSIKFSSHLTSEYWYIYARPSSTKVMMFATQGDGDVLMLKANSTTSAEFSGRVTAVAYDTYSDARLKKEVSPLTNSLNLLSTLKGYHYYWKDPKKGQSLQTGVIAQEIEKVFPELINKGDKGYLSVDYAGLIPHLIESVKTLKEENDLLKDRLAKVEAFIKMQEDKSVHKSDK